MDKLKYALDDYKAIVAISRKINELVDAVNELEQVKARVEKLEQDIEVLKRG